MQAPNLAQRSFAHRRSPNPEPGPPPNVPVRSMSPNVDLQPRSSTASARSVQSSSSRRVNREGSGGSGSNMPLSQIEKSVTHLLVATKQLLETLTQWSRGQATDAQVSDVYVRLGYEFNMACRAFTAINVDTSDLGNVPDSLRHILEATLSQEASSESLEKYLPRIRDIIINLLHGLKRKQQKLRQKQGRDRDGTAAPDRATSVSTVGSGTSGLSNMLEEGLENGFHPDPQRGESLNHPANLNQSPSRRFNAQRDPSRISVASEQSSISSNTMQSMPVMPPYPESESTMPSPPSHQINIDSFPPPPPPPPDTKSSALAALQKGGDLERRASRRYSQYQISKHLGGANGVPILPSQNGPVPNRGRKEARESLRAVQVRGSVRHNREASNLSQKNGLVDSSPIRIPSRVSEESSIAELPGQADSPVIQTPEDKYAPSATLSGPPADPMLFEDVRSPEEENKRFDQIQASQVSAPTPDHKPTEAASYFQDSPPPTPTKDLTLFLQYKSKVKKIVIPEGRDELTIGRLQLAFIEKFSWNTQQNGADLPEIYIQDPISGVRHELEDLSDIKDRTVLVLNIEALDEVKRHIDDGIAGLTKIVREVKQNVDDQGAALQRVSDRQQEAASEMTRMTMASPAPAPAADGSKPLVSPGRKLNAGHIGELQHLRRDLAVMRQTYSKFQTEIQTSMSTIRNKAANVKVAAAKTAIPDFEGDAGYGYVTSGRKQLNTDSDRLVGKVDDLQDLIEDLRKDVVHRGVRPLPRQLESVAKDVTVLTMELKRMEEYMGQEKPIWTKIWEKELEDVCQGRDELRLMEDLLVDLRDDLEKASETFTLVEQATKEQMKDNGTTVSAGTARQFSRGLNSLGSNADPNAAKEGVLGEVRALQPNHEDRLEAIERAEKLRQKELESRRGNPMHNEIVAYVGDGKLKKAGGFEEVERARKAKDDRIRREVWERQNGIVPDHPVGEEEAAAAALHDDSEGASLDEPELQPQGEDGTPPETNGVLPLAVRLFLIDLLLPRREHLVDSPATGLSHISHQGLSRAGPLGHAATHQRKHQALDSPSFPRRILASLTLLGEQTVKVYMRLSLVQRILAAIGILCMAVMGLLALLYSHAFFKWLDPAAEKWRALPGGWLIVFALMIVTSFPPIIGYSTVATISGFVYGFPLGWPIVASGCTLGALGAFLASRTVLSSYVDRMVGKDHRFVALGQVLRQEGIWYLTAIRFCPLPFSLSNGFLATIPSITPLAFTVSTALSSPKLLVHVFIGSRLALIIEKGDTMTVAEKAVNYVSMFIGGAVGLTVGLIIYRRTMARASELAREEVLGATAEEGEAGYEDGDSQTLMDPEDAAVLMSDDDISLWDRQEDSYRDEEEDNDDESGKKKDDNGSSGR
ncbi:hypothetical protein G7046_g8374 [Stylonectria norvegica]|nr:hypothetical protein G7046_g8374 [Stylonectria norvegica]